MTESDLQEVLLDKYMRKGHTLIIPNVYLFGSNESDMVSITKSRLVWEYEIKISKQDFLADRSKRRYDRYERRQGLMPNRFWYVSPEGIITEPDLPEYAGLLYVMPYSHSKRFIVKTIKMAPMLHKNEVSSKMIMELGTKIYHKYWRIRRQLNDSLRAREEMRKDMKRLEI